MARLTYETTRHGLDVWLATDARHMTVEVRRSGRLLAKSHAPHYGLLGPSARSPEKSSFAEYLTEEAIAKAFGRPLRSAFDQLVDELAREMHGRGAQRILLFKSKPTRRKGGLYTPMPQRSIKGGRRK